MMTYPEIHKFFGTPLSQVPKPNVPFKLKMHHVVICFIVLTVIGYGLYSLNRDFTKYINSQKQKKNK